MNEQNVLIVENNTEIKDCVRMILESEGFTVDEAEDGRQCINQVSDRLDLIILDAVLPGSSGYKLCEEIRKQSTVPILFLNDKSSESDRMLGMMAGGDDFLAKPFSYAELLERVKALIRRYRVYNGKNKVDADTGYIEIGKLKIHKEFNEVFVNNKAVELTNNEYNILLLMMSHPGRIFSAENIYEKVWNESYFYSCNDTIMVHIRKLRMKIEQNPNKPEYIKTIWGKGYKIEKNK